MLTSAWQRRNRKQQDSLKEFLKATAVIDCDSPPVAALAAELADGSAEVERFARRCFFWVRDRVRHSVDHQDTVVTCSASEVLRHRTGLCYAKSHLLAALLRAGGIPAALCYQRLAADEQGKLFCLHGLVSVHLPIFGWYRIDPRGDKNGVRTDFSPPVEHVAFRPTLPGEIDIPERFPDALPSVVSALRRYSTVRELAVNLPDWQPFGGRLCR